jgi:hypothetical protein
MIYHPRMRIGRANASRGAAPRSPRAPVPALRLPSPPPPPPPPPHPFRPGRPFRPSLPPRPPLAPRPPRPAGGLTAPRVPAPRQELRRRGHAGCLAACKRDEASELEQLRLQVAPAALA